MPRSRSWRRSEARTAVLDRREQGRPLLGRGIVDDVAAVADASPVTVQATASPVSVQASASPVTV